MGARPARSALARRAGRRTGRGLCAMFVWDPTPAHWSSAPAGVLNAGANGAPSSLGGGARTLRRRDPHAQHCLRQRVGRALHRFTSGKGGGDQRLLQVGELDDLGLVCLG